MELNQDISSRDTKWLVRAKQIILCIQIQMPRLGTSDIWTCITEEYGIIITTQDTPVADLIPLTVVSQA